MASGIQEVNEQRKGWRGIETDKEKALELYYVVTKKRMLVHSGRINA